MNPTSPIRWDISALSGAVFLCAALLAPPQVAAQAPAEEQTPETEPTPVLTPAVRSVKTPPDRLPTGTQDGMWSTDTPGADSAVITPTPFGKAASETDIDTDGQAPARLNTPFTSTSEQPDPWPGTLPAVDSSHASARSDPLEQARKRWRGAVSGGQTDLGFRAWIMAALGQQDTGVAQGTSTATPPATAALADPLAGMAPADSQASRTRNVSVRWLERAGPVALGNAGRVVTTFGAAIPTAYCAPLIVCYIELEPGEVLTDTPSWGDTSRWQVTVKVQGSDPETVVLEIKPSEDAGLTNLVIPTDRRLYTINLLNDPEVHTPILSFAYPDTATRAAAAQIAARKAQEAETSARATAKKQAAAAARRARLAKTGLETSSGLRDPGQLDFRFTITGAAPFRPVRVYTDGRKTYIDLHPTYRGPLPTIIPGRGEGNKALNTRVDKGGKRLVADRVIKDIWLSDGSGKVRIRRGGA